MNIANLALLAALSAPAILQAAETQHYTVYLNASPLVQGLYAELQQSRDTLTLQRQQSCERLNENWLDSLRLKLEQLNARSSASTPQAGKLKTGP
ncbi:hypothetical protein PVT67_13510 [Gallaecimonas kandeliae]|uniref:hypothetical protein n=1 Tax=Gallaecimonas kandeliae TaxID=3029055 RepID=UPI002649DDAA|nr:hypothetical protein [Gallaecimonas kandeliae]WKE64677.1 hypothetical protein PVT67_13510 [Gallaecimonas kandeliae]